MELKGRYVADGSDKILEFPSGIDWIEVVNETTRDAQGDGTKIIGGFWQTGVTNTYGFSNYKSNAAHTVETDGLTATNGFIYIDSTSSRLGAVNTTITAISNASPPVVSLTSTTGITTGSIVRMGKVAGGLQFNGVDFTVGTVVANTSFPLTFAPTIVAATTGSLYPVIYEDRFYPRSRFITSITASGTSAVIVLTVTHGYSVGDEIRLSIPSEFGMVEADSKVVTITAVNTTLNNITVDLDITGYTAFAWPTTAYLGQYAQTIPVSESPIDSGYIGMRLKAAAGSAGVAGSANDVISWRAGVSDY